MQKTCRVLQLQEECNLYPTRRCISIGCSTTTTGIRPFFTHRGRCCRTSITRQTRWIPFINGPSFARDISRCSVVTPRALPAAHIHILDRVINEKTIIFIVCLCRRRMGVCAYVSDLRSSRVPHKARPEEKLQIRGRIMIMIIVITYNSSNNIIIMLPPIRSVYTERTQHDRPRSLNVCIHLVPGVAFVRATRSTLVVYRACIILLLLSIVRIEAI